MDGDRFDAWTRSLAAPGSRRAALRALAAGAAAGTMALLTGRSAAADHRPLGAACACRPGQVTCGGHCASRYCARGVCACRPPTEACAGSCVDTTSDPANCGRCGKACRAPANGTATCVDGGCGFACAAGFKPCDRRCVRETDC